MPHPPFRLGPWLVRPDRLCLEAGPRAVALDPTPMALLCRLADAPGRTVPREALLAAVWPGVVVGDEALTQAVSRLRRALGDDARAPRFVETVPTVGYRLVATVADAEPASPSRRWSRPARWATAALAVAVGGLVWPTAPPAGDTPEAGTLVVLSPDGTTRTVTLDPEAGAAWSATGEVLLDSAGVVRLTP